MSALGQKQTCAVQKAMSALPPKADGDGHTHELPALLHHRGLIAQPLIIGPQALGLLVVRPVRVLGAPEPL